MKRLILGITVASIAVLSPVQASAAGTTISGTVVTKRVISRSLALPGDGPTHAMAQTVREEAITSSDPAWNDVEAVAYEQSDGAASGGSHRGYIVVRHKNGEQSYLRYEGKDRVAGEGGAREVAAEGTIQVTGGTGSFKGMKGAGKYRGKASAKESVVQWELTLESPR